MSDQELLKAIQEIVKNEVQSSHNILENRLEKLETDTRQTRVLIENGQMRIEKLLKEAYQPLAERVRKVDDYDETKETIKSHERAIKSHNERLGNIEKAI